MGLILARVAPTFSHCMLRFCVCGCGEETEWEWSEGGSREGNLGLGMEEVLATVGLGGRLLICRVLRAWKGGLEGRIN